jgi:SMODS and SLOG-associating 2TM effector domain 2
MAVQPVEPKHDEARSRNIRPVEPDALVWDSNDPTASLKKIGDAVEAEAETAYEWYWKQKRWKRIPSQWIQFLAVTLTAVAGLAPVVVQVWKNFKGITLVSDTGPVASLCVGIAAALLGIDKAFGYSTGWVRYVMAATSITRLLQEFRMDWVALKAAASVPVSAEQQTAMLQRAKMFIGALQDIVTQETKDWMTEFQSNMAQMEKDIKSQLDTLKAQVAKDAKGRMDASKAGAIELTIPNAAKADSFRCDVFLEGVSGTFTDALANSIIWTRINVAPGQYKLRLDAKKDGSPISTSAILEIKAGETCKASLPLPIV